MQFSTDLFMSALYMLPAALFVLAALGVIGASAIAPVNEMIARSKKKVFFDKYAEQITAMNLGAAVLALIGAGAGFFMYLSKSAWFQIWIKDSVTEQVVFFASTAVLLVAALIYKTTWKKLRKQKNTHIPIGLVITLSALAVLICTIFIAIKMRLAFLAIMGMKDAVLASIQGLYMPLVAFAFCAALASAATLSAVYLVLRRNKDDFGRDYYNFSLPLAAKWSCISTAATLAVQGWLISVLPAAAQQQLFGGAVMQIWAAGLICGVAACATWLPIIRSNTPLRYKGLSFIGAILFWLSTACFLATSTFIASAIA